MKLLLADRPMVAALAGLACLKIISCGVLGIEYPKLPLVVRFITFTPFLGLDL